MFACLGCAGLKYKIKPTKVVAVFHKTKTAVFYFIIGYSVLSEAKSRLYVGVGYWIFVFSF